MISLKTQLYPHQVAAVEKLKRVKVGALYMEQGTGKTRTALELIKLRLDAGKINSVIWLCPCSVKQNLKNEILQRLQKDSIKELIELVAKTAHAVVAIRNDLQLPDETAAILEYYRESTKEIGNLFPEFVDEIWGVVNKTIEGERKLANQ